MLELEKKVQGYIEKYHMLDYGDRIVLGVSGGADSVCLFFVMLALKETYNLSFHVVHVNHMLRGEEALRDQKFVEALCACYEVPCHVFCEDIKTMALQKNMTLEEAGREFRYSCFTKIMNQEKAHKIAVAHHQVDQAETVLFHLMRGSGLTGLAGMAPISEVLIRPLLSTNKKEILNYLDIKATAYCEDETNQSVEYTRNKIRHKILPLMEEINGNAVPHIFACAQLTREALSYLEEKKKETFEHAICCSGEDYFLSKKIYEKLHPFMKKELIYKLLTQGAGVSKNISAVHVDAVAELMVNQPGRYICLPYGLKAWREYDGIRIRKQNREKKDCPTDRKDCPQAPVYRIEHGGEYALPAFDALVKFCILPYDISRLPGKKKYTKAFDYDKIKGVLEIRTRLPKDRIAISDDGGSKTLKKYFIDEKIPREDRERLPVLADGHDILWVIGHRIGTSYKITDTTRRICLVEYRTKEKEKMNDGR